MTLRYWYSTATTTSRPTSARCWKSSPKCTPSARSRLPRPCPSWRYGLLSSVLGLAASHGTEKYLAGGYQRTAWRARRWGADGRHVPIGRPVDRTAESVGPSPGFGRWRLARRWRDFTRATSPMIAHGPPGRRATDGGNVRRPG
jgi:hypothetical protein